MTTATAMMDAIAWPKARRFQPRAAEGESVNWSSFREALSFSLSRRKKLGVPVEDRKRFSHLVKAADLDASSIVIAGGRVMLVGGPHGDIECDSLLTNKAFYVWSTEMRFRFYMKMSNKEIIGCLEKRNGLKVAWNQVSVVDELYVKKVLTKAHLVLEPILSDDKQENRRSCSVIASLVALAEGQALKREKAANKR